MCVNGGGGLMTICALWVKAVLQVWGALIYLQVCICVCVNVRLFCASDQKTALCIMREGSSISHIQVQYCIMHVYSHRHTRTHRTEERIRNDKCKDRGRQKNDRVKVTGVSAQHFNALWKSFNIFRTSSKIPAQNTQTLKFKNVLQASAGAKW